MAHALYRLRAKVFNTPQLMQLTEFENVVDYINKRCEEDEPNSGGGPSESNYRYSYNSDKQVAVMEIDGPLSYKPITFFGMNCGGTDYQTLKEDFEYLAEKGVKTVAFNVDSPGGEAYQLFPTAQYIRKIADEYDITLITYVDGLSASAAYGLSVISDEIILAPGSEVGSIGVVVRLMNDSKALEKQGYQRTFVTAGKSKVPFEENGEFRKEFIEDIQEKVDVLYSEFTEHVALHRNMSVDTVRSTEAKTFLPEKAIELGLADRVMTVEEFYTYLADVAQNEEGSKPMKNKLFNLSQGEDMSQIAELQAQLDAAKAQLAIAETSVAELVTVKESLTEMTAQLEAKSTEMTTLAEQVASLSTQAAVSKAQARKSQLTEARVPADKIEAISESLAGLSDEAFAVVASGYKAQAQAVEASALMEELGSDVDATVETDKPKTNTTEEAIKARLTN